MQPDEIVALPESVSPPNQPGGLLDQLLAVIGKEAFFRSVPDSRVVHIPGDRRRYRELFDAHAFRVAATHAQSLHALFLDTDGWLIDVSIAEEQVGRMISAGVAVCAGKLRMKGPLDDFLKACSAASPGGTDFSCSAFLAPRGSSFGLHIDAQPTLILQLAGQRRWEYTAVPEPLPVEINIALMPGADSVHLPWGVLHRPSKERMESVVLNAGDALYLPAGCWHQGYSLGESFSLSLTTAAMSPLDAFRKALDEGVSGDDWVGDRDGQAGSSTGIATHTPDDAYSMVSPGMSLLDLRAAWDALADATTRQPGDPDAKSRS